MIILLAESLTDWNSTRSNVEFFGFMFKLFEGFGSSLSSNNAFNILKEVRLEIGKVAWVTGSSDTMTWLRDANKTARRVTSKIPKTNVTPNADDYITIEASKQRPEFIEIRFLVLLCTMKTTVYFVGLH